jgi:hypothetical protein
LRFITRSSAAFGLRSLGMSTNATKQAKKDKLLLFSQQTTALVKEIQSEWQKKGTVQRTSACTEFTKPTAKFFVILDFGFFSCEVVLYSIQLRRVIRFINRELKAVRGFGRLVYPKSRLIQSINQSFDSPYSDKKHFMVSKVINQPIDQIVFR